MRTCILWRHGPARLTPSSSPLANLTTRWCGTPTTWTPLQKNGPNHLGLRYNALSEHQMALVTSGCVPCSLRSGAVTAPPTSPPMTTRTAAAAATLTGPVRPPARTTSPSAATPAPSAVRTPSTLRRPALQAARPTRAPRSAPASTVSHSSKALQLRHSAACLHRHHLLFRAAAEFLSLRQARAVMLISPTATLSAPPASGTSSALT